MVSLGDKAISLTYQIWNLGRKLDFSIWGVFWVRSDLESRKKVRVFNFEGGVLG